MPRLPKLLFFIALAALLSVGCGRSDLLSYEGTSATDGGPDGSRDSGPTRCMTSQDCGSTPATPYCELPPGVCVACLTMPDTCPNGEACDPTTHQCQGLPPGGCTSDSMCPRTKPFCDIPTRTCVGCLNSSDCPPGEICQNLECIPVCGPGGACGTGLSCCGPVCVDEATNPSDCGGCGRACAAGEACVGGACQPGANCQTTGCANNDTCCGTVCVNTETSATHCGSCTNRCPGGDTCDLGGCVSPTSCNGGPICTGAEQCCRTGCADVENDPNNCGFCDRSCGRGGVCQGGQCVSSSCNGGPACNRTETCCASGCTDTTTDPNNCSQCGFQCPSGSSCLDGNCQPTTSCNGGPACTGIDTCCQTGCTDTQTDPQNCAGCGNACPPAFTCAAGNCQPPTSCNGGPVCRGVEQCCTTGCTDIDTDPRNCGGCGQPCAAGDTCVAGVCQAPPNCNGGPVCTGTEQCCTTGCTDTTTDPKNCGRCGNPCAAGDTCVANACAKPTSCNGGPACTGGQTCCATGCLTTTSDPNNCGGCDIVCAMADTCVDGSCVSNEGAFNPTVNPTFLSPGVHSYTSINIPAGVTVYVAGAGAASGTLDLNATGAIVINGTIDVSGGPGTQNTITSTSTQAGRAGGGGFTGEPYQSAVGSAACSFVAGNGGSLGDAVSGTAGSCTVASTTTCISQNDPNSLLFAAPVATYGGGGGVFTGYRAYGAGGGGPAGGAPGALGAPYPGEQDCGGVSAGGGAVNGQGGAGSGPYAGRPGVVGQTQCPGLQPGVPPAYVGGGGGGSIGIAAISDLQVASTFQTGSAGGGGSADYLNRPVFGGTSGGGGGGGALKLASMTSITIQGQVLANGGAGGDAVIGIGSDANCDPQPGAGGGGGSGGVIYLSAPSISVPAGAVISAAGGVGGAESEFATGGGGGNGGLGRIRLSVTAPTCSSLGGSFTPTLPAGCAAGPAKAGVAFIATYPN